MKRSRIAFLALTLGPLVAALSCDGTPATGPEADLVASMEVVSGDLQEGPWGEELPEPLKVRVLDGKGHGVRNQIVAFRVLEGGGSMFAGVAITDREGYAQDWWTLGLPGPQAVEARAVDPSTGMKLVFASFSATATGDGPPPPEPEDADGDGYTVADGDCADNNPSIHPGAVDDPDDLLIDSNCDGIDGDFDAAILVSAATGTDDPGCGFPGSPCRSVQFGIDRAVEVVRYATYVAAGTYNEGVTMADGVSLYGGFAPDFSSRDPASQTSSVQGSIPVGASEPVTLLAQGLTIPVEVMDMRFVGVNASGQTSAGQGKNTYTILIRNVGPNILSITGSEIVAANGAPGLAGANGTSASQNRAAAGGTGGSGSEFSTTCNDSSRGSGGSGGSSSAGLGGGDGGYGGKMDTECDEVLGIPVVVNGNATPGLSGSPGLGALGKAGGPGGQPCLSTPPAPGQTGGVSHGTQGQGGTNGSLIGGEWRGEDGTGGSLGQHGGGGGGGGGAGGCDDGIDSYGAGGGGGGAGGLRAPGGGQGGAAGGGSFAVFLFNASVLLEANTVTLGVGGNGGDGGDGGLGQPGGSGGPGGSAGTPDARPGARGGDGGNGGNSGAGGGGQGGIAAGFFHAGTGSLNGFLNTFSGGAGGTGGSGGSVAGQSGGDGATGAVANVVNS